MNRCIILLILCVSSICLGFNVKPRKMASFAAGIISFVGTELSFPEPNVHAATLIESVRVEDVPGQRGNGGIDSIGAAFSAQGQYKAQTTLSDSDFKRAQNGEIPMADGPRATKRRAMKGCKDADALKAANVDAKTCVNRVMDDDIQFILDAMK